MIYPAQSFEAIAHYKFINLTTFRKNGEPVSTPVTFAISDDKMYVITGKTTGKVKRLRNNPRVQIAPSDQRGHALGEAMNAQAQILSDEAGQQVRRQIKFGAPAPLMFIFNLIRDLRQGGNVYLEIHR